MLCGISQVAWAADAYFPFMEILDVTIKIKEGQTEEEAATEIIQELINKHNLLLNETEDLMDGQINNFAILPAQPAAGGGGGLRRRSLGGLNERVYLSGVTTSSRCFGCPSYISPKPPHYAGKRRLVKESTLLRKVRQLGIAESIDQIIDIQAIPLSQSDKVQLNATYAKTVVALTKDELDALALLLDGLAPDDESRPAVVAQIAKLQSRLVKEEEALEKAVKLEDDLFDAAGSEEQKVLLVKKNGLDIDEAIIEKINRDLIMVETGN